MKRCERTLDLVDMLEKLNPVVRDVKPAHVKHKTLAERLCENGLMVRKMERDKHERQDKGTDKTHHSKRRISNQ